MNLPTKITVLRIFLVPAYAIVFLYTPWKILALVLFIVASSTDGVDGYLARKYHMVTDLGKFLDPLADKILTLSAFVLFTAIGQLSPLITIIIIAREITISVFRAVAASKHRVIAASTWGKLKTILQVICIIVLHLYLILHREQDILYTVLTLSTAVVTLFSGLDYLYKNREILRQE